MAYLALGSNLGDRKAQLLEAQKQLQAHPQITVSKVSSIYETEPWPKHKVQNGREVEISPQEWHLNQVLQIQTLLTDSELLEATQAIEKKMGKIQKKVWGSREIDIDLLLYGEEKVDSPGLKIPHPYMTQRQFVLVPLLEIAPNLKEPGSQKPYQEYLEEIGEKHEIQPYLD